MFCVYRKINGYGITGKIKLNRARLKLFRLLLLKISLALSLHIPAYGIEQSIRDHAWQPAITLFGNGDQQKAVSAMTELAELQTLIFERTVVHPETELFIDELWKSLERFDIQRLHNMLPEEQGEWRRNVLIGQISGDHYRIGPPNYIKDGLLFESFSLQRLADWSAEFRSKPVGSTKSFQIYQLEFDIAYALGRFNWRGVRQFSQETLQILTEENTVFSEVDKEMRQLKIYRFRTQKAHPKLNENDIDIVAPLWGRFSKVMELFQ